MNRLIISAVAVLLLLSCHVAIGAEKADPRAADEAAIRHAVETYVAAFNRGDAEATAAHWSEGGEWVSPAGQKFKGRKVIQEEMAAFFAENPHRRIDILNPAVRFLAPTVAVEEGRARVTLSGDAPSETSYMAIHVKHDGRWKLDSVRETLLPAVPSHYDQLKDLEWLIGTWIDGDESATIETVCEWTKNKNFITRSFKVAIEDRIELEGTQVIGWDPAAGAIRSWMFDSDGGFGDGVWTSKGNRWVIKASRVLNGGEKGSAVNILTRIDNDSFTWQSIGREIDGELQPNIDEVKVVRKPAAK